MGFGLWSWVSFAFGFTTFAFLDYEKVVLGCTVLGLVCNATKRGFWIGTSNPISMQPNRVPSQISMEAEGILG